MPDISRSYIQTLPSITRILFLSSLGLCLLISAAQLPLLGYLPDAVVLPLRSLLHPFSFSLPASLHTTLFSSAFYLHLHRLLSPFLLYPLLLPSTFALSVVSFVLLALYSRAIEEEYYFNPSGAAQYASALAFAVTFLLSLSLIPKPSMSMLSKSPSTVPESSLPLGRLDAPSGPYFDLSLAMLQFIITLYTSLDPYRPLSFTGMLLQWQSAYVLAVLLSVLAPPSLPYLALGIVACYAYHFATSGSQRVWGRRLWGTPSWLVALFERWGVGIKRIGFTAQEGGRELGQGEQQQQQQH